MNKLPEVKCRFKYSGYARLVHNCTFEWETNTMIGMEVRKSGKFSNKIKRYRLDRMEGDIEVYA